MGRRENGQLRAEEVRKLLNISGQRLTQLREKGILTGEMITPRLFLYDQDSVEAEQKRRLEELAKAEQGAQRGKGAPPRKPAPLATDPAPVKKDETQND